MDYTKQTFSFKLRKFWRYIRMYGVRRAFIKVQGQYHMKRFYKSLPEVTVAAADGKKHVGIIGCGNFAYCVVAFYLRKNYGYVIRGVMDIDIHKAASLFEKYKLDYFTDDATRILDDPAIDLVYISSNHASHAEYAIKALEAGKSVHIEKPHVVDKDQLNRLCFVMARTPGKVSLGFNRPHSRLGKVIKKHIDSQTGPSMFNWFVAGHVISSEHWYLNKEEGGRVFGNLCHWTDFVLQLVQPEARYPLIINPTRWEKTDCDIAVSYIFGDGSIAVITFSAKGLDPFEGIFESFAAQRGNVLIRMDNFKNLAVEIVEKKINIRSAFRDHGHEVNIKRSYGLARSERGIAAKGDSVDYVYETGNLFLKTREALEDDRKIVIQSSGFPPLQ